MDAELKISKLELALNEQKDRESTLKTLHSDELKYLSDMHGHELKLY